MTAERSVLDRRSLRRWAGELAARYDGALAAAAVAARLVAEHHRVAPPVDPAEHPPVRPGHGPSRPPAAWCTPRLAGQVYEVLIDPADRRRRATWFTPPPLVDGLVALALDGRPPPRTVLDPACGGGAFLVGVADGLVARGVTPAQVPDRLTGIDIDPGAAAVTRWSLDLWSSLHGVAPAGGRVVVADGLQAPLDPVDLVVGNPPYGTPLRAARAGSPGDRYRATRDHLGPYADDAVCFLDRAAGVVTGGGRLVLVLPQSLLTSRDAAGALDRFGSGWALRDLWIAESAVFDAAVHVFAPILERRAEPVTGATAGSSSVGLHGGIGVVPVGRAPATGGWAGAAASALGVPEVAPLRPVGGGSAAAPTLVQLATATSGFRDQHYGLVEACREAGPAGREPEPGNPIVTVGQIDPLTWVRDRPVRFGRRLWARPVVEVETLEGPLAAWTAKQLRPKVLLATQSRVLEPLIDRTGSLVPATPVIAVHAAPEDLDRVCAVLLAPPVVAWAARRSIGTALHPQAIKLAARQVLELPLPPDHGPWDQAAALLAPVDATRPVDPERLAAVAALMCRAYGVPEEPLWTWWWQRLPRRAGPGSPPAAPRGAGRVDP